MNSWIVLDRDGVINHTAKGPIVTLAQWMAIPGSLEAIVALSRHGYKVIIATNLSDLSKGLVTTPEVDAIHAHMCGEVTSMGGRIEGVYVCPHTEGDGCDCRKPRIGLLDKIERDLGADLRNAYMVGDSLKDIQAARAKGCQPVLVRTGNGLQTENTTLLWPKYGQDLAVFEDLAEFTQSLLMKR